MPVVPEDRVVGGLQPEGVARAGDAFDETVLVLTPREALPELAVLGGAGELVAAEHAVMLANDLVEGVPGGGAEVLVRCDDGAVDLELDDGLGAIESSELGASDEGGLLLEGDVRGDLDDARGASLAVKDRVVGGAQPQLFAGLGDAPELTLLELAVCEGTPEVAVLLGSDELVAAEEAVMLADDLVERVPGGGAKVVVRRDDSAVDLELDDGLGAIEGGDLGAGNDGGLLLGGDVRGDLDDARRSPVAVKDRVVSGAQPELLSGLRDAAELALLKFAVSEGAPEAGVPVRGGHLVAAEEAVMLADDLVEGVAGGGAEVLVRRDDGAVDLELDDRQGAREGVEGRVRAARRRGGVLHESDRAAVGLHGEGHRRQGALTLDRDGEAAAAGPGVPGVTIGGGPGAERDAGELACL